ncbi:G-protein alpha subunit-domain-containing protein [Melanogaster broomeanus]|nr:G-protein alpha subunit-domain-containing protein [Melanogaster broomeanus]
MNVPLVPNRRRSLSDPLSAALQPPPNETPSDRDRRLFAELEAKRVSDGIDEMLRQESKEKKPEVKILLLGQSESGKSTTLKQFQLMHAPAAFHADRIAWRAVIYLNLVRSVRRILDAISPDSECLDDNAEFEPHSRSIFRRSSSTQVGKYDQYRRSLEPLKDLEERLIRMLSSPDEDEPTHIPPARPNWNSYSTANYSKNGRPTPVITIPQSSTGSSKSKTAEVSVHHRSNWKKAFSLGNKIRSPKSAHTNEIEGWWDRPLRSSLWKDTNVKQRLRERKLRVEESSGFFLDEITRITALRYFPTDQDVLKARLKTIGIVEHTFSIPNTQHSNIDWKIYDVGGSRNQRNAWAPYFEDVNRLEDSFLLWKSLVSNKLLMNVSVILFLNKIDLLQAKLKSGVRLKDHLPNYSDRPNDYDNVSRYFYNKFGSIHQEYSANKSRELKIHFTSVTDTRRTATIIHNVREIIITANLKSLHLM